jgi:hypothetical protein
MEKAKNSPLGLKEDWKKNVEKAFEDGVARVPPQATRFVLASQIDFESKEPFWEAAVIDLDRGDSMEQLAKARKGAEEKIEGLPAVRLANGAYVLQLGPKRLAAMGPGDRQTVVRWVREVRRRSPPPLSPYLQRAAVYSDEAGSDIIMALDLEGAMSWERVGGYLKKYEKSLRQWQTAEKMPMSLSEVAEVLSSVHGIRIGVRIGEQSSAKIVVDLRDDAGHVAAFAKPLLLQVLSDNGALINDFQSWTAEAKGNELSLAGILSRSGLRRLLSVVDSPASDDAAASPGEQPISQAEKSRQYFRTIVAMADDLKDDMKKAANLASTQLYFDKYAKRIERMPILGVDDELLQYSAFVANCLRQATGSVKTMGIQTGVRTAVGTGADYSNYRWVDPYADLKASATERIAVRAQEKAVAATDVQSLRQAMIAATFNIRRRMTQKYQIEF